MFSKLLTFCAFVAVAQPGFLAAPVHYSPTAAVSSQSIMRYDQPASHTNIAAQDEFTYHAAPSQHSSAAAVSSQSFVRHYHPDSYAFIAAPTTAPSFHNSGRHNQPSSHGTPAASAVTNYNAGPAPLVYNVASAVLNYAEPFDANPEYEYNYSVADSLTGDIKSQQRARDGGVVNGWYEANGSVKIVKNSADDHNGFNAVVHNNAPTDGSVKYYHH